MVADESNGSHGMAVLPRPSLEWVTWLCSENHAWGPRARTLGKLGPGEPVSLTAFLRKAGLVEADPVSAVCTKLLTIEIF
jgi:hypothetical protein